jgi:hypothetical protein
MKLNKYNFFQMFIALCFLSCDSHLVTPLAHFCDGEIVVSAQEYKPMEKIHKVILYEKNERSDWNTNLPVECQGKYSNFELVGCIEKTDDVEIEKCSYPNGGTRTRKAQKVTITIFEAKTGKQIDSNNFYGHVDNCPQTIPSRTDEVIDGDNVSYDQVKGWLLNLVAPVLGVCDGVIVESAQEYDPGASIHKIILYENNEQSDWNKNLPEECHGTYTDFELVGCIEKTNNVEIEKCNYTNGGTRTRKTQRVTITIFAAKTGQQIASNIFYGHVDYCPTTISSISDEVINGDNVSYDQVKDWLLGYLLK